MDVEFAIPPQCIRDYVHRCIFDQLIDWEATMDGIVLDAMQPGQCTSRRVSDNAPHCGQVTVCRQPDGQHRAVVSIGMTVISTSVGPTGYVVEALDRVQADAPMLSMCAH